MKRVTLLRPALSAAVLATALAGVPRDRYVLSTKVGRLILPDGKIVFDFSRDGVLRSVEESLRRLRLDRVDILLVHDPDDHEHEALEHEHAHVHDDGHHTHRHDPMPVGAHSHVHRHEPTRHAHPHVPDEHHLHRH